MSATDEAEIEQNDEEECPKCPPVGAPAWMATFADMATLLMAFFVLILSFAEFNVPKFKQITGSLNNAFGIQRDTPVVEQPKGTTVISLSFSPSPTPSVVDQLTQQTTETRKPKSNYKPKPKTPMRAKARHRKSPKPCRMRLPVAILKSKPWAKKWSSILLKTRKTNNCRIVETDNGRAGRCQARSRSVAAGCLVWRIGAEIDRFGRTCGAKQQPASMGGDGQDGDQGSNKSRTNAPNWLKMS